MTDEADRLRDWRQRLLTAMAEWKADPCYVRWQMVVSILNESMGEAE